MCTKREWIIFLMGILFMDGSMHGWLALNNIPFNVAVYEFDTRANGATAITFFILIIVLYFVAKKLK